MKIGCGEIHRKIQGATDLLRLANLGDPRRAVWLFWKITLGLLRWVSMNSPARFGQQIWTDIFQSLIFEGFKVLVHTPFGCLQLLAPHFLRGLPLGFWVITQAFISLLPLPFTRLPSELTHSLPGLY